MVSIDKKFKNRPTDISIRMEIFDLLILAIRINHTCYE